MAGNERGFARRDVTRGLIAGAGLIAAGVARAQSAPPLTPESPLGPFYPIRHAADNDADMVQLRGHARRARGTVIEVSGRLLDRHGRPISGGSLEIWQANAAGRYAHAGDISTAPLDPDFQGYAKIATARDGEWRITTIRPAGYGSPIGRRPPHIHFDVAGRDHRTVAQMYFAEDAAANAVDLLYRDLGEAAPLSVARLVSPGKYRWDVVLLDG